MKHDQELDQALFMLSAGELSGLDKLKAEVHLLMCPQCSKRISAHGSTARRLMGAFGNQRAASIPMIDLAQIKLKLTVYVVATIALVSIVVGTVVVAAQSHTAAPPPMNCRPGILSDKCQ